MLLGIPTAGWVIGGLAFWMLSQRRNNPPAQVKTVTVASTPAPASGTIQKPQSTQDKINALQKTFQNTVAEEVGKTVRTVTTSLPGIIKAVSGK